MVDNQIVDLYWQRNPDAITETNIKYGKYCSSIAFRICQNKEDSEECVNDTWYRAWNAMPDARPSILSTFLGRITRNLALDRLESKKRKKRGGGETVLALEELEECIADDSDVEKQVEAKELEKAVNQFLRELKDVERRIFLARYWYLMPVSEIALRADFSESKVKSMLHRTRLKLRDYLCEEGYV